MSTLSTFPTFIAPRPVPVSQTVRLTRRGRLVVFAAALTVLLLSAFFLGSVAVGSETPGQAEPTEVVMVGTGDTLWEIASEVSAEGDIRSTMNEIERLNALDTVALSAGQKLRVPISNG